MVIHQLQSLNYCFTCSSQNWNKQIKISLNPLKAFNL